MEFTGGNQSSLLGWLCRLHHRSIRHDLQLRHHHYHAGLLHPLSSPPHSSQCFGIIPLVLVAQEVPVEGDDKITLLELWNKIMCSSLAMGSLSFADILRRLQDTFQIDFIEKQEDHTHSHTATAAVYSPVVNSSDDRDMEMTIHGEDKKEDRLQLQRDIAGHGEDHLGEEEEFV
jgi:hypothetical protein